MSEQASVYKRDFYRDLREVIAVWEKDRGWFYEYLEYPLMLPDFFYLLIRLMMDNRVPTKAKTKIILFLIYYLSPIDIIPVALLGPIGFGDDLVLAVWTANSLLKSVDRQVLVENWPSHPDRLATLETIMESADKWIGKGAFQKIRAFVSKRFSKSD
jgi:uncharacterized membrane protein YkvA (DUF1232 family)